MAKRQIPLMDRMMQHLAQAEMVQDEIAQAEAVASDQARGHWPAQQEVLSRDWTYKRLVGLRNYRQTMVHLYAAVITAVSTAQLAGHELPLGSWTPPGPRGATERVEPA